MSITHFIARMIADYDKQDSLGTKLRAKRIVPLLSMIEEFYSVYGFVNIIDIGGTEEYWQIVPNHFLDKHKVTITVINLPDTGMPADHSHYRFVEADGCALAKFADKAFHIAHSNSVIEHVGDWSRMVSFASEISRVALSYFVQTPNFWFPMEPHFMTPFFHWLPKPTQLFLVMHFQLGHRNLATNINEAVRLVDSVSLLSKKMFSALFDDAKINYETFLFMRKSFIATRKKIC